MFRGKLLEAFELALKEGRLRTKEAAGRLLLRRAAAQDFVVYSKPPMAGPEQVLRYLGRYTHRIAISNERLLAHRDGEVTFSFKDRKNGGRRKEMTLPGAEFTRRFLLHVVPRRFVRVRHYGLLANGVKARRLAPGAQPARHPRATRAVQGQARVLARRLSPSRGKGPATLPRLSRRPARRGGRHPPLTDSAAPRVSFQVAVNPSARLSRRKLAAVRRSTCLRAALATLARSPLAARVTRIPPSSPTPAILRLASPGTITVSGANRLAYNPHTARHPRFSPTGLFP